MIINPSSIDHLEAALAFCFFGNYRNEFIDFLNRDLPSLAQRAPSGGRRGAPPKDNLRRFLEEFSFHVERVGGHVSGSWNRDATKITGKFAEALGVVYDELLPPEAQSKINRLTFLRETKKLSKHGWRARGKRSAADYAIRTMNAWRD